MLAVTGANGHLGLRLLEACGHERARALVRSRSGADAVRARYRGECMDVRVVDYGDPHDLARALGGCSAVAHLVGIVREGAKSRYRQAHQDTCRALAEAAARAGVGRIIYLSIVGATPGAKNPCLASKGEAERLLQDGGVPATVIRLPMVLGEGDFAARALAARARRSWNVVLRGASLEQPVYAGDVVAAVRAAASAAAVAPLYELAGPESLPRAALVQRAAGVLKRRTRILSLPLWIGIAAAGLLEKLLAEPPVTRAMLGVLDHDDRVDTAPAVGALDLTLTPLDETLRRCLGVSETSA